MKKALLLLLIAASCAYSSEPLDLSLIPLSGSNHQAIILPALGQHADRQLTRFEQGIVKKAAEKLEKIFKEQEAREAEFNLFLLPFELQVQILTYLTQKQLERFAGVSRTCRSLVSAYRGQVTAFDLSNEPKVTLNLLRAIRRLPNLKKIIIYRPGVKGSWMEYFIKMLLGKQFPHLEHIKLLNHVHNNSSDKIGKFLSSWKLNKPGRTLEYTQVYPDGKQVQYREDGIYIVSPKGDIHGA